MTEPSVSAGTLAARQRLRVNYDEAVSRTAARGRQTRTAVDAARAALQALASAVHAEFTEPDDRARLDPLIEGLSRVTGSLARSLDDQRAAWEARREAADAAERLIELGRLDLAAKKKQYQQEIKRHIRAGADPLAQPMDELMAQVVGTALGGFASAPHPPQLPQPPRSGAEGLPLPTADPPPDWPDGPALLRVVHELVKALHAQPGAADEALADLRTQLRAQGIAVLDTVSEDTAACFRFHPDDHLPPGEVRVDEPAIARIGPEGRPEPVPDRLGLILRGPHRTTTEDTP